MSLTYDLAYVRSALPENDSRAALDRVEAEIARLQKIERNNSVLFDKWKAAEAEAARLRDGLRHYRLAHGTRCMCSACNTARALLAEDGAA